MTDPIRRAAVSLVIDEGDGQEPARVLCVWNLRYKMWTLPGGMVEDGESADAAQRRELEEETGILTQSARPVFQGPHGLESTRPGRAAEVCLFVVEAIGEPRQIEDGCPIRWMTVVDFVKQSKFGEFYARVLPGIVAIEVLERKTAMGGGA